MRMSVHVCVYLSYACVCIYGVCTCMSGYGVARVSRIDKIIDLFCRILSLL